MKKLLGLTLALAMIAPTGANAQLFKNLKVSGQLDVQTNSANNITDLQTGNAANGIYNNNNENTFNDHIGNAYERLMVSAEWDLLDDVHSRVSVVKGAQNLGGSRTWGSNPNNVTALQNDTYVEEANVKIDKVFGAVDTKIGRQYFGEPGDLIAYYGAKDNYGLEISAIDAFRFDWAGENFGVTGLAGQTNNSATVTTVPTANTDLTALLANYKVDAGSLGAYIYNQEIHSTNAPGAANGKNTNLYIIGLKGKVNVAGLMAKAEIAKDLGDNRSDGNGTTSEQTSNYAGWALLADLAYKLDVPNAAAVTPWGEFGYGSGRSRSNSSHDDGFVSIASDYRPGGIYGRFDSSSALPLGTGGTYTNGNASSNGLNNRVIYGIGVKATPAAISKLTVGVQAYKYAFASTSDQAVFNNAGHQTQYSRDIGTEGDITAEWKHSENVGFKLTLGSFLPGAYFADSYNNVGGFANTGKNAALNPATLVAFDTSIKF